MLKAIRDTALVAVSICIGTLAGVAVACAAVAAALILFADVGWTWAIGFGLMLGGPPGAFMGFFLGVFFGVPNADRPSCGRDAT